MSHEIEEMLDVWMETTLKRNTIVLWKTFLIQKDTNLLTHPRSNKTSFMSVYVTKSTYLLPLLFFVSFLPDQQMIKHKFPLKHFTYC